MNLYQFQRFHMYTPSYTSKHLLKFMLMTELQHFLNNSIAVTGQNYIQPNIF